MAILNVESTVFKSSVFQHWARDPTWGHLEFKKIYLKKTTDKIIIYKIMIKDTTQSSIKQLHSVTITKINQCSIYKYLIDISKYMTATKRSLGSLA